MKWSDPENIFKGSTCNFYGSKTCKKGYMEMTKKIYLEPLKTAPRRSIYHYFNGWHPAIKKCCLCSLSSSVASLAITQWIHISNVSFSGKLLLFTYQRQLIRYLTKHYYIFQRVCLNVVLVIKQVPTSKSDTLQ